MNMTSENKRISVLVVDDERHGLAAIKDTVLNTGVAHICAQASSVAEAVKAAEKTQPDCLVLDYHLSDGNAMDIVTELHLEDRTIIISADNSKKETVARSNIPFIQKPANIHELKTLFLSLNQSKSKRITS